MLPSTHALLDGIVDYAGTFPPARLALADALAEYARARKSADSWLLGRLVVPAVSLSELERLAPEVMSREGITLGDLSVIVSGELRSQLERVHAFNDKWATTTRIASV